MKKPEAAPALVLARFEEPESAMDPTNLTSKEALQEALTLMAADRVCLSCWCLVLVDYLEPQLGYCLVTTRGVRCPQTSMLMKLTTASQQIKC